MLNRVFASILRPFLDQYIEGFDSNKIEVELLNGKAQLTDLNFKADCLIQHQIPLFIKHGLINSLTLSISSEQCEININNLFIVGSEVFNSTFIPEEYFSRPKSAIINLITPIIQPILNIFLESSIDSLRKIFYNLTVKIEKVHIRIEGLMNKSQSFGIIIKSINIFSIDHKGEKAKVQNNQPTFSKEVSFDYFGLYFDTEAVKINYNEFEQQMLIAISNLNHKFVLDPFTFNCIFEYNTENNVITDLEVSTDNINLFFDLKQFAALKNLIENFKARDLKHLGLPSKDFRPYKPIRSEKSGSVWWYYTYRCIVFKKNKDKKNFDIQKAIDFLKNRKKFYETWKKFIVNPDRHKKEYNDLIHNLDSDTLPLLRSYSCFYVSREMGNSKQDLTEGEIIRFFKGPKKVNNLKFKVVIKKEFYIGIKDDLGKELFSIDIQGLQLSGEKNQNLNSPSQKVNNSITFEAKSICAHNYLNERYPKMFDFDGGINGTAEFNNVDPIHIFLSIPSFSFVFDAELFSTLLDLVGNMSNLFGIEINLKNEDDKQALIDSHKKIKLDLNVKNTNLLIPYQEIEQNQPIFKISLDSFEVHSSPSSKYDLNKIDSLLDEYKISVNSLQLFLNENEISNKIVVSSHIKNRVVQIKDHETVIVDCKASPIYVRLTFFQVLLLNELFSYISDKLNIESIKKISIPKTNNSIDFNIKVDVQPITIILMYNDTNELLNTNSFKIELKDHTLINASNKNQILNVQVSNNSGIECLEYFTSNEGKLLTTNKFELKMLSIKPIINIELDINDIEVYAKAVPLNFLIVLAQFPKDYEWMLHLNEESAISKYLHVSKKKQKSNNDVNASINIRLNKTNVHLIESVLKKENHGVTIEEKEFLALLTNQISITVNKELNKNSIKIEIDPPQAKTNQFGTIWTNVISKNENPPEPIVINIEPPSVSFNIDNFIANLSPLLLLKIVKFVLIVKNPYAKLHGDPVTVKYINLDISIPKVIIRIIHDIESRNYYELNVTDFKFNTIDPPMNHQIQFEDIQITQKIQNRIDNQLFEIKNMNIILAMKFLLRDISYKNKTKTFNEFLNEEGIENWTERTVNFLNMKKDELIHSYFYFYSLKLKFEINELLCTYSHEFARNIAYSAFRLLDILKQDSFYNFKDHKFQNSENQLAISVDLEMTKGSFSIVDQSYLLLAKLIIDSAKLDIDPKNWIYNAIVDKISLIGENEEEKILETSQLSINTFDDDLYANLNSLELFVKLKYWPDAVYYIMNCPLFSFVDEFKEKVQKQTSFEMKMGLFISLNNFKVTLPIQENLVTLNASFDIFLTPEGKFVQVRDIHMFLKDHLIIQKFSIQFENDSWDIDPIFITFSVFEVHIIKLLIKEINSLKMPQIYVFKKEAELKKRKFSVKLKKIDIVLTQPNLPFVSLEIKPSTFTQTYSTENEDEKIIEYKVEMLLKHENYSNHGTDIIIDPFELNVKSSVINHKSSTVAKVSPINIALSSSFLSEIFQFQKKYSIYKNSNYDSNFFNEKIIYFQNDTLWPITITLQKTEGEESKELFNNTPINLNKYDLKSKIKILYDDQTIEFLIKDLFYPIFFNGIIVVYLAAEFGIQIIHFSSTYIVRNKLYYDIDVYIGRIGMGIVKKGSEKPIPINFIQFLKKGIIAMNNSNSNPSPAIDIINNKQQIYKFYNEQSKKNFYSSVYISTDVQRSLRVITFLPYITFENQLPIDIEMTFLGKDKIDFNLKIGKKYDVSYLKDKIFKQKIKIKIESFGESDETEITNYDKSKKPIRIPIKRGNDINCYVSLMCVYDEKTDTYNNIIFAPCILYNETNSALSMKGSTNNFYSFIQKMYIHTPKEFISSKNVPLRILMKGMTNMNEKEINCLKIKSIEKISLPFVDNKDIFYQISAIKKKSKFENTTNLVLKVHFTVFNHTNSDIFLIPSNIKINDDESFFSDNKEIKEFRICCKSNRKSYIYMSNLEGKFTFCIKNYEMCNEVNFNNQTTTVFRLISQIKDKFNLLIQLDVIKEEGGFCGHFSYASFPSPLVITNMIPNTVILVEQKSDEKKQHPMIVESYSTSLFAKRQPFIEQNLIYENFVSLTILKDEQIPFTVHFSHDMSPQKIKETKFFYEVKTTQNGDKMILVTEQNVNNDEQQNLNENMILVEMPFMSIFLSKIEISFIDKLMRELGLLVIKNINLIYRKQESITFSIESFRLNDMYADAKSPVVLCEKATRFLLVEIKSKLPLKMHSFESIDIDISPLHVFVDLVFVSDFFYMINEIIVDSKISNEDQNENEMQSTENFRRYSFHSIKKIKISPICIDFSKVGSFSRKYRLPRPENIHPVLVIFKYISIPLSLNKTFDKYENKNIRAPLNNFIKSLIENYKSQVSLSDLISISIFSDSSAIKISSENFNEMIQNLNDKDIEKYKNKGIITKPERIPRAFPMNRITSFSLNKENNTKFCQFSMAQITFQKSKPNECLLLLIQSKKENDNENSFLAIFNHFIVHLSEDLKSIKIVIKINNSINTKIEGNQIFVSNRKNNIKFICENEEDMKLVVTTIKSICDRIQLLEK